MVCATHFEEHFIIREDSITRPDGTVITAKRGTPTLTKDAYPTLFPNQPQYMSKKAPPARVNPQVRKEKVLVRDELQFREWMENDMINSYGEFCDNFVAKVSKGWLFVTTDGFVSFLKICCNDQPKITTSFKVMKDLKVQIWYENIELDSRKFKWLLGSENKCDRWSKFENLISHMSSYSESAISNVDKLSHCIKVIKEILENDSESEYDTHSKSGVLWFCGEQLCMFCKDNMRYSCDFLVWAYSLYLSSPSLYTDLRDSKVIILPHPNYLRKFDVRSANSVFTDNSHELFLRENLRNLRNLRSEEKIANLLLDEIHVKKKSHI